MKKNYNSKTLDYARKEGYEIGRVEAYNSFTRKRSDLFGIIDYVGLCLGMPLIGIQSTGPTGLYSHHKTIITEPLTIVWLASGCRLVLISWRKNPKGRYFPLIREYFIKDSLVEFVVKTDLVPLH
jgi:hypothetical protein